MKLYQGKTVLYRWRPGQVRGGSQDAAALVLRVRSPGGVPDGTLDLIVWPAGDRDPLFLDNVAAMSDRVTNHCWHLPAEDPAAKIADLEKRVAQLEAIIKRATRKAA